MRWEEDELLTVKEIAAVLKLNQQTIRNWLDAGSIPHVRVGERRVRVWRSDLQAFLTAAETAGHATPAPAPQAPPPASIWDGTIPPPVLPRHR